MRRAALERPLMLRRVRQDVEKHRPSSCACTPGRFRKSRPWGCPKGRACFICSKALKRDRDLRRAPPEFE